MTDTARALPALQALLADNTTSEISPQDLRDVLVSVLGGYGGLYAGASSAQAVDIAAAKLTAWSGTFPAAGTTPDVSDDSIILAVGASYLVTFAASFLGTAGREFTFQLRLAGVAVSGALATRMLASATDVASVALSAIVTAAALDKLTVYVSADADGASATIKSATMSVKRVT